MTITLEFLLVIVINVLSVGVFIGGLAIMLRGISFQSMPIAINHTKDNIL